MHTEFKPEDPDVLKEMGYDRRDLNMPLLRKYIFWITFGCVLCFIVAIPTYNYVSSPGNVFEAMLGSKREPAPQTKNHIQAPNPLLQDNFSTKVDIIDMRQHEEQVMSTYGWVDQNNGVVHIPIEKAMERVLSGGVSTGQSVPAKSTGNTISQNAVGPGSSKPLPETH